MTEQNQNLSLVQERRFRVDDSIIYHLIKSQSFDEGWALKELIQNSFDSGASSCSITITELGFTCTDDGKGFSGIKEIEDFFETFGAPQREENNTVFAKFRMGRGQIMSFASTIWETNGFEMEVCIKTMGLNYKLRSNPSSSIKGCRIEGKWYEAKHRAFIESIERELEHYCRYMFSFNVFLNGQKISRSARDCDIALETENMFFLKSDWGLEVYNLGLFVNRLPSIPVDGVVVTKKSLPLNISRDQVEMSSPLWREITQELLPFNRRSKAFKNAVLVEDIPSILLSIYRDARYLIHHRKDKILFNYCHRRRYSLNELAEQKKPILFAPKNRDAVTDKISQRGIAIILSSDPFFEIDPDVTRGANAFVEKLKSAYEENPEGLSALKAFLPLLGEYEEFRNSFSEASELLSEKELTAKEVAALRAIKATILYIRAKLATTMSGVDHNTAWRHRDLHSKIFYDWYHRCERNIFIGVAHGKRAWTDGKTFIAIHRDLLSLMGRGVYGCDVICTTLLHELCHDENLTEHDGEFYEAFHKLLCGTATSGILVQMSLKLNERFAYHLERNGKKPSKSTLKYLKDKM